MTTSRTMIMKMTDYNNDNDNDNDTHTDTHTKLPIMLSTG